MRDQLPHKPEYVETGIINLDKSSNQGTHWVAYAIDPRGIVYFDSYGLAPPKEFFEYINRDSITRKIPVWYSTLPTQKITDLPICGRESLAVLDTTPSSPTTPPHKVVSVYTSNAYTSSVLNNR